MQRGNNQPYWMPIDQTGEAVPDSDTRGQQRIINQMENQKTPDAGCLPFRLGLSCVWETGCESLWEEWGHCLSLSLWDVCSAWSPDIFHSEVFIKIITFYYIWRVKASVAWTEMTTLI